MKFFKVDDIYVKIEKESEQLGPAVEVPDPVLECKFDEFQTLTNEEIVKLIRSMAHKHCDLDPIPTSMISNLLPELVEMISHIVNTSLTSGTFPSDLKVAQVRPSFKLKQGDKEDFKNYRPVSNLSFISKVMIRYRNRFGIVGRVQSAYRRNHSVETTTVKILDDLLLLTDDNSKAVLLLLDLSAAFDTIDHGRLLKKLQNNYGIGGKVLEWFRSYLTGRTSSVRIGNTSSTPRDITIGVPQGSILGPILFIMYTQELEHIVKTHNMQLHLYADDSQLYCSFKTADLAATEEKINKCLLDVQKWMAKNRLMLNSGKTEVMIIRSPYDHEPSPTSITLFGTSTDTVESARNLGVIFDEKLSMEKHVSHVVRGCMGYLTNLWRIGDMLDCQSKVRMVNVFIHSKRDFCNSLLHGISIKQLNRLQKVQNSATRYIFGWKRRRGVTTLRRRLHFLPVTTRIHFKICLLMHQVVHGSAPDDLTTEIQKRRQKSVNLRANDDKTLLEEKIHGHLNMATTLEYTSLPSADLDGISGNIFVPGSDNNDNTLDEPVSTTLMRDLRAVGSKFYHVLIPKDGSLLLQDWDLWGPLLLCTLLAILLQGHGGDSDNDGGPQFAQVFVIIWVGAAVVTINSKLLDGKLSFFQSICL
eukprot:sb/3462909/